MSAKRPNDCEDFEETGKPEAKKQKTIDIYFSKNGQESTEKIKDKDDSLVDCDNDFKGDHVTPKDNKGENVSQMTGEKSTKQKEVIACNSQNKDFQDTEGEPRQEEDKSNNKKTEEKTVTAHVDTHSDKFLDSHINYSDKDQSEANDDKPTCSTEPVEETENKESKHKDESRSKHKESTHRHEHKHKESTHRHGHKHKESTHRHEHKHKKDSKDKDKHSSDTRKKSPESKGHRDSRNDRNIPKDEKSVSHESPKEKTNRKKISRGEDSEDARGSKSPEKGHKNSQNDNNIPKDEKSVSHESPKEKTNRKKISRGEDSEDAHGSKSPEMGHKNSQNDKNIPKEEKSFSRESPKGKSRHTKHSRDEDSEESRGSKSPEKKPQSSHGYRKRSDEEKKSNKRKHDSSEDESTPRKLKNKRKNESSEGESINDRTPPKHINYLKYDEVPQQSQTPGFEFFYGMKSPFSQFHPARFEKNGIQYNCAEQYMMHQKAVLFNDKENGKKILQETKPLNQKRLGRKVRGFDPVEWGKKCIDIVKEGNIAKFSQNAHLKSQLLGTYPKILAESSPRDCLWGIGFSPSNPKAWDQKTWRGKNLLGYALTEVRTFLMEKEGRVK